MGPDQAQTNWAYSSVRQMPSPVYKYPAPWHPQSHKLLWCQIILCSAVKSFFAQLNSYICLCIFFYFAIFVLHSVQVTIFTVKFPKKKPNKQTKQNSLSYVLWLEKPRLRKDFYIFLPLQIAGVFSYFHCPIW